MASYQKNLEKLEELGMSVMAGTVEDRETAARMAEEVGLTFPIAYGITEDQVAALAPLWTEDDRHGRYVQPTEFLVAKRRRTAFGTMYASGPIGRMSVDEVLYLLGNLARSRQRRRS